MMNTVAGQLPLSADRPPHPKRPHIAERPSGPPERRVEERRAGRAVDGARIPASSAIPPVPRTPLRLRFLSPLIEPSVRISDPGLSFKIMRSPTRSRAVRPILHPRPLCSQPPGKRTSSRTPPRASDSATDAAAVPPAPVPPTAALRRPGTRFTSACYVEFGVMWIRTAKPLPRNTFGEIRSTQLLG